MTVGVKTFSTENREVKKFESKPPAPGEYEGMLRFTGKGWTVAVGEGRGKLPYLTGPIELLNTASTDGGKNKVIFHRFFLDTTPSAKDGVAMIDRGNGITAFSKATSTPLTMEGDNAILEKEKAVSPESDDVTVVEILNPQLVLQWLKQFEGVVFKLRTKIDKGTQGYADRGAVDYFIEADPH